MLRKVLQGMLIQSKTRKGEKANTQIAVLLTVMNGRKGSLEGLVNEIPDWLQAVRRHGTM